MSAVGTADRKRWPQAGSRRLGTFTPTAEGTFLYTLAGELDVSAADLLAAVQPGATVTTAADAVTVPGRNRQAEAEFNFHSRLMPAGWTGRALAAPGALFTFTS